MNENEPQKIPVILLTFAIIALLFWIDARNIDQYSIITVSINAAFIVFIIGLVLKYALGSDAEIFLTSALLVVGVGIGSYLSTFVYTGLLASDDANKDDVEKASLVMQVLMYSIIAALAFWIIIKSNDI